MATKKINVSLDSELADALKAHAEKKEISIEDAAASILSTGLSRLKALNAYAAKQRKAAKAEGKTKAPKAAKAKAAPKAKAAAATKAAPKAKAAPKIETKAAAKAAPAKPAPATPSKKSLILGAASKAGILRNGAASKTATPAAETTTTAPN